MASVAPYFWKSCVRSLIGLNFENVQLEYNKVNPTGKQPVQTDKLAYSPSLSPY